MDSKLSAPFKVTDKSQQFFLPAGKASLIQNVGTTNNVYLANYDGLTSTDFQYILTPGSTVQWGNETRVYAICAAGQTTDLLVFTSGNFVAGTA